MISLCLKIEYHHYYLLIKYLKFLIAEYYFKCIIDNFFSLNKALNKKKKNKEQENKKYDIEVKQQILHTKFNLYYYNYLYI